MENLSGGAALAKRAGGSIARGNTATDPAADAKSGDASACGAGGRIALFDNIKGMLIVLVVFGHIAHPVHNDNLALSAAFDFIYLFHMPLFVLMSGLFAKGAYREGRLNVNRIVSFTVLAFAYQITLALINGADLTPMRILAFTSAPWYLVSMACWYAATPLLARLGRVRGLAFSAVVSLLWGMIDLSGGFLAISRTMAFLPFFALGYYLEPGDLMRLRGRKITRVALLISGGIVLARLIDAGAYAWFFPMVYGDNPYTQGILMGVAQKAVAWGAAAPLSLALIGFAPMGQSGLTVLGRRTLQIYVLHRLIRAWLTFHTPLYGMAFMNDPVVGTIAVVVLTAAITALCACGVLEKPFTRLLRLRWVGAQGLVDSRPRN